MLCAKEQRALRSRKQKDFLDRCWGKVFCVHDLEVSLCVRHYEKLRGENETTCCFPQNSSADSCCGRLKKCPQRLVTVLESLVKDKEKFKLNPHICEKHFLQADTEERVVHSKHYVSPRKVSIIKFIFFVSNYITMD